MIIEKNHIISFYKGKNKSKGRVIGIVQRVDDVIMEIIHYDIEQYNKLEKFTIGITPMYNLTIHDTEASIEKLIHHLTIDQKNLIDGCKIELQQRLNYNKKNPIKKLQRELMMYQSIDLKLVKKQFKRTLKTQQQLKNHNNGNKSRKTKKREPYILSVCR